MATYINAISTAVPSFKFSQSEIMNFMIRSQDLSPEDASRLSSLYKATGIETRYSVLEDYALQPGQFKFYPNNKNLEPFPSTGKRMAAYKKHALPLALQAIRKLGTETETFKNISHLIVVSCTGMYAPGLDIEIIEALKLPSHIQRTAINFMGCYAAFNALKVADSVCKADENAVVMIVCLELCTLHFQKEKTEVNMLANSLFSDGCAAVLVSSELKKPVSLKVGAFYSDLALDAGDNMTWDISDTGFEMVLSSEVPNAIKKGIKELTNNLFKKFNMTIHEADFYAIHPGGRKILEVIGEELCIDRFQNRFAYNVLKDYGNMSSPTILFVIKNLWESLRPDHNRNHVLSFAFGPGLTLESMLLQVTFGYEDRF